MTAVGLGLCGAALLAAPVPPAGTSRLRRMCTPADTADEAPVRPVPHADRRLHAALRVLGARSGPVQVAALAAASGALLAGAALGMAAAIAAATVTWLARCHTRERALRADADALLEAVSSLTGELRAGSTPEAALWAAARVPAAARPGSGRNRGAGGFGASSPVGRVLGTAAATASLGGDVPAALRTTAVECAPQLRGAVRRIAAGWQVSERSGASLGAVLDRVEHDLRAGRRQAHQIEAHLAGPRATGAMLALLPGFGLILGTAMGAHPVRILLDGGFGPLALVVGVGLDAVGAVWTTRLLRAGTG